MTDQQTYSDLSDVTLTIDAARGWGEPDHLSVTVSDCSCHPSDHPNATGLLVPTARLLAMIDAEDPDGMRAYLRETVEHEVPEADSPEDIDELPDVEQARAAGEQIGKIMRAFGDAYAEAMKR